jgi:hypothetical protein
VCTSQMVLVGNLIPSPEWGRAFPPIPLPPNVRRCPRDSRGCSQASSRHLVVRRVQLIAKGAATEQVAIPKRTCCGDRLLTHTVHANEERQQPNPRQRCSDPPTDIATRRFAPSREPVGQWLGWQHPHGLLCHRPELCAHGFRQLGFNHRLSACSSRCFQRPRWVTTSPPEAQAHALEDLSAPQGAIRGPAEPVGGWCGTPARALA